MTTPTHVKWPKIGHFHQVCATVAADNMPYTTNDMVYRAKVKLHGCNVAVGRHIDGTLYCQSRNRIITPEDDQYGFAAFVRDNNSAFAGVFPGTLVFGEWCGKGINQGAAICQIDRKVFAVFAAVMLTSNGMVRTPKQLEQLVDTAHPDVFVLPWHIDQPMAIGPDSADDVTPLVDAVEACDPWVKETFGIEGVGEGLVFYPMASDYFAHLGFKAKGEKHSDVKRKTPASKDPAVAASAEAFADMVCTEARLEKGLAEVGERTAQNTGAFLKWFCQDVETECQLELNASGLTWALANKAVQQRARAWWFR